MIRTRALEVAIAGKTVCSGLELTLAAGENWAVLGANGSGKTTLLHTLAGLRRPQAGSVQLDGQPLHDMPRRLRARRLGLLFQDPEDGFPAQVLETVLMGRHPHLPRWRFEDRGDVELAGGALAAVDLAGFEHRSLQTLSGGERRRVGIATLLAQDPPVCLLDEPTNHLDLRHGLRVLALMRERSRRPAHLNVFVLHDLNLALRYCSHALLLLGGGECVHGPLQDVITPERLEHMYGCPVRPIRDGGRTWYLPA